MHAPDGARALPPSEHTRPQLVAPLPVHLRSIFFRYPLRWITADMSNADTTDTVSEQPSWDSSQLSQRAWLDDLLSWLPTKNTAYASL
eukprot:4933229-Pleurochrysis_carterae.AAC.1